MADTMLFKETILTMVVLKPKQRAANWFYFFQILLSKRPFELRVIAKFSDLLLAIALSLILPVCLPAPLPL